MRVRIPANVDQEDQLLAGLTARQLVVLGIPAVALWVLYAATRGVLPLPVFAALAGPIAAGASVLALGRRHSLSADRLAVAAWRQLRAPRRLVPAPEGVVPPPTWAASEKTTALPAPLTLPARDLHPAGVVDLGPHGVALVCRASAINFGLRTEGEQEALVATFARLLNAIAGAVQFVVRAERADLSHAVAAVTDAAAALPHPALEAAARGHAAFLASVAADRDVLCRRVVVVFRAAAGEHAAEALARRADEAAGMLAAAGIALTPLDGAGAAAVLAAATNSDGPPRPAGLSAPGEVITGVTR